MKHIPEYYQLIEQNEKFVNGCVIKICLKEEVDGKGLDAAVQKAIARYPYFAVKVSRDAQEDYDIKHNDSPIAVLKKKSEKLVLGSAEVNGHLLAAEYEDCDVYFLFNHALAGGCGMMNFIKAVMFLYFSEKYHKGYDKTGFLLPGMPQLPGERDYPTLESLSGRESLPGRQSAQKYLPMADYALISQHPEEALDGYYQIKLNQKDVMSYVRSADGSPAASISVLMFKALNKIIPESAGDFDGMIAHNYCADAGCPNTTHDLVRRIVISYKRSFVNKTDEELGTITRGQIIAGTLPERAIADAMDMLSNNEAVDGLATFEEKKAYGSSHNRYKTGIRPCYAISYAGNISWGALTPYIDAVYSIVLGHLLIEVNAVGDKICIGFMTMLKKDNYIKGFLKELENAGIPYEVSGPFKKDLPGLLV